MCKAKHYADQINGLCGNIQKDYDSFIEQVSYCDKAIQDMLHIIECEKFNVCEGYKYANKLRQLRQQRRVAKNELEAIKPLVERLKPKFFEKTYNRVNKLEDIIQKEHQYRLRALNDIDIIGIVKTTKLV